MTLSAALAIPAARDLIEGIEDLARSLRDRSDPTLTRLIEREIADLQARFHISYDPR